MADWLTTEPRAGRLGAACDPLVADDVEDLPDLGAIGLSHADDQRASVGFEDLAAHDDFMAVRTLLGVGGGSQGQQQGHTDKGAASTLSQRRVGRRERVEKKIHVHEWISC
ncbi:MAG: hypothetical protein CL625_07535 [Arenimonas sp.]|nr:hypothetical protein [Arenimonas sp.]